MVGGRSAMSRELQLTCQIVTLSYPVSRVGQVNLA